MEIENENLFNKYRLYNNLNNLEGKEYLIILDFYHVIIDNEEKMIMEYMNTIKEYSPIDKNILYLLFMKNTVLDKLNKNDKQFVGILNNCSNIFVEDKLANIYFMAGYAFSKNITIYIFADNTTKNSRWLKFNDSIEKLLKFSEYDYLKITLDYLLKDKKRNYDFNNINNNRKQSKLSMLLNKSENKVPIESNGEESNKNKSELNIIYTYNFLQIIENLKNNFINNPPKNFQMIKNTILNLSEQNSLYFWKNFKISEKDLSFLLFSQILEKEILINKILRNLIFDKIVNSFEDIDKLLSFYVNMNINNLMTMESISEDLEGEIEISILNNNNTNANNLNREDNLKKKSKRKKKYIVPFSLNKDSETEYTNLIIKCPVICSYVRKIIIKIISSIGVTNIDKFPTQPGKYKNFILAFVNNQELLKLSKNILNFEYEKLVNIITEGIIIELMRNNLVIFKSEKQIYYNVAEIEREKFRMTKNEINNSLTK